MHRACVPKGCSLSSAAAARTPAGALRRRSYRSLSWGPAARHRPLLACILRRRPADMSSEGDAEGAGGTVTDALRDLGDTAFVTPQQVFRERHAPGEQIFHRRHADCVAEALEKSRTR